MALTAGSRFSTRLIARARARMSPERSRPTRSGSLSSLAQPVPREVVPDHHHQTISLLAAGRRGVAGGRGGERGTEEARKPLGGAGDLAVRRVKSRWR